MTSILDSMSKISELDNSNMLGSIEALSDQIKDAWEQANLVTIPDDYKNIENVVVSGMGGSALGSHVIKNLYKKTLKVPFEVISHYELPDYVSSNTLVLLSSYSGTTEETISAAEDALARKAKVMVITSGGKLQELSQANNWPTYLINPKYNPCNQPRLAIGYAIAGQLALFKKAGIITVSDEEIEHSIAGLKRLAMRLGPSNTEQNLAKDLSYALYDKKVILVSAEHLIGAAHVFNNQLNENSKMITAEWPIPEFNHHYLEALTYPRSSQDTTIFVLISSSLYHERVIKRFPITQQIIEQKGFECQVIHATAPTPIEQVFEIILLGEYIALYLPILYGIDPSAIPNVEAFKELLN